MHDASVKSARRALEILEYFDEVRSDASVMEFVRELNYPQSSASGILKCLAEMGYLSYDPQKRRYAPTHRVALLGSWIQSPQLGGGRVLELMEELSELTHETIILAEQPGTIVRYIHVVPSRKTMRLHVGPRTTRPLARSGIGRLFLSTYPEERIRSLFKRINADAGPDDPILRLSDMEEALAAIRERGYSFLTHGVTPGAGIVAMMLPHEEGSPGLALAIGGFSQSIAGNEAELVELMRSGIARHIVDVRH